MYGKPNLLGGGRITSFIERLAELPTLKDFLSIKEKTEGWCVGSGYIVGSEKDKADFITGQNNIPVEALTEDGIDAKQINKCWLKYFERPRKLKKDIYKAPHILIRTIIGDQKIPIELSNEYLTFPFWNCRNTCSKKFRSRNYQNYLNILMKITNYFVHIF